ncbi:MAG: Chromosome partition protein Smc [Parcubacteria group bacterium GW2011_GWA2_46_7]|nr:MAG: Chromosome partition protein Smc [Parcubacteria group bacterium GW2011_GWA2_46_7]
MLKSIEISGFKSFADRTVLDFPVGITAVVGPNGSGKSNVVDAIRWVLGEQSSKNIRINNSADVIFSGTPTRSSSAFAHIGIHFDNSRNIFPTEYSEVFIARKIYRDGNSEYFINKKQIRLKDVTQLLAGAKLGVKGMSIINQGAADIFLRATPVERREMIEEMVGLKEYRIKKEEAERKIRETRENLSRVQTLIAEMEPNLHSLSRQVSRWQSRAEKEAELKLCEERYFVWKFYELEHIAGSGAITSGGMAELCAKRDSFEKSIGELTAQISTLDTRDPAVTAKKEELSALSHTLRDQKTEIVRRLGNIEGQLEALRRSREKQELVPFAPIRASIRKTIDLLTGAQTKNELSGVKNAIQEVIGILKVVFDGGQEAGKDQPDEKNLMVDRDHDTKELERVTKVLYECEQQAQRIQSDMFRQSEELRSAYKVLEDQRIALREIDGDQRESAGFAPLSEEEIRELEMKIIRFRRDLGVIGEIDASIVTEYEEINTRHTFLETQEKDLSTALADWETLNESLEQKIQLGFNAALLKIDKEFDRYFGLIFDGGKASLRIARAETQPLPFEEGSEHPEVPTENTTAQEHRHRDQDSGSTASELGIEFSVHLPRKKIRSLEMLSGGEKALTAIALLFAIIAYARPPFLVFDEIDATLDERNSSKVGALLKDLAGQVQFILITHNRSIMEAAQVLYGITMDDGVSRVFSLHFAEAEEIAKRDVHPT